MKGCRKLEDQEIEAVLAIVKTNRDRCLVTLAAKTGLRISELLSIDVEDVWQHGQVSDYVTIKKANTKGKVESKTLPLSPAAKQAIYDHIKDEVKTGPLFRSQWGDHRISRMQAHRVIRAAFDKLEMKGNLGFHAFRKTYARKVHKALGEDILKTQQALCHKSLASTASYLEVDRDEVEAAIRGLG